MACPLIESSKVVYWCSESPPLHLTVLGSCSCFTFCAFYLQSSGVTVQQNCLTVFNEIKMGHKYRYIIYCLTPDLREITVLKAAPPGKTIGR